MSVDFLGPGAVGVPMFEAEQDYKTEAGQRFHRRDFAYTPDSVPSHWKLRLVSVPGGKPDPHIVGAAVAALGKGYRGNEVQIPAKDLPAVKRRVLRAWHAANPGKKSDEVPPVLKGLEAMTDRQSTVPPGWEASRQRLVQRGDVEDPGAVAWWLHTRGIAPVQGISDIHAAFDREAAASQAQPLPPIFAAAARGETWAQVLLLAPRALHLVTERWA